MADGFSLATWSFLVESPRELLAGLTITETIYSRLAGIPIDLIVGSVYGKYMNYLRKKFDAENVYGFLNKGRLKRTAADTVAFTTFMMPIYAAVLYFIGVDFFSGLVAVLSAIPYSIWQGGPQGIYSDFIRKK